MARAAGAAGLILAFATGASPLSAQAVDRTNPPALQPPPNFRLPPVQRRALPNHLQVQVVEMHEVPLVQFTLMVRVGGRQDGARPGLASFMANMLDEGADTLDAIGIAAEAAHLGATLSTTANWDYTYINLQVPKRTMLPALDLMAMVALRPTFRSVEVARQRDLRIAQLVQDRDDPEVLAELAFNALVFPAEHPYHRSLVGDSGSTARLDSAAVRDFYRRFFLPDRAHLIVTGDVTPAEIQAAVKERFGSWKASGLPLAGAPALAVPTGPTAVYLVNKPGAAQSVIEIGGPGVERSSPDYHALEVMNTLLGGSFSSRLNQNLRETRGYTYGAFSGFDYRPLPGPFRATAAVRTDVTDSSLVEFFKELNRIRNEPVDSVEVARAKAFLALGLGSRFETTAQMAAQIANLVTFGLPSTYFDDYVTRIMAVTAGDVRRVAMKYLRPDRYTVVVVGDIAKIRPGIEALELGPISVRDQSGSETR